jgi:hypothetical protein
VITLFVMLGATLALFIPLWGNRDTINPGQRFPWGTAKLQNSDLLRKRLAVSAIPSGQYFGNGD